MICCFYGKFPLNIIIKDLDRCQLPGFILTGVEIGKRGNESNGVSAQLNIFALQFQHLFAPYLHQFSAVVYNLHKIWCSLGKICIKFGAIWDKFASNLNLFYFVCKVPCVCRAGPSDEAESVLLVEIYNRNYTGWSKKKIMM